MRIAIPQKGGDSHLLSSRVRRRAENLLLDVFFIGLSQLSRLLRLANPRRRELRVYRDVSYRKKGLEEHRLDIYVPNSPGPWPVILYFHGGGFRILSKDSSWIFGAKFAERGYLVLNANYRLAPRHPFPAAVEDACAAYCWMAEHGKSYGADLEKVILAGESAGANLALALCLAACRQNTEAFARAVYDTNVIPQAVMPACGLLQVSNPGRFAPLNGRSSIVYDRILEIAEAYLGDLSTLVIGSQELADPLVTLEKADKLDRPFPKSFITCGTRDVLIDDSRRLERALAKHGAFCESQYYEGELHAFHAFVFRRNAKRWWRDSFRFLEELG